MELDNFTNLFHYEVNYAIFAERKKYLQEKRSSLAIAEPKQAEELFSLVTILS